MGSGMRVISFITKSIASAVIVSCSMLTMWTVGPYVETKYFPVVSKLSIERSYQDSDGKSVVYAEFNKIRNCEYVGLSWYKGSRDSKFQSVRVVLGRAEGDESSQNRPQGRQSSGPWTISMPLEELKNNSFAQLSHRCHPFWITTTDFYP